ncbi:MAG: hypothetical protein KA116_04610 [Proteobacteria bacterium]|nr:hypothetical protein [Pseudomonadota bacterium]
MKYLGKTNGLLNKIQKSLFIYAIFQSNFSLAASSPDPLVELIYQAEQRAAKTDSICHQEIYDRSRLMIYSAFLEALKNLPQEHWEAAINRYSSVSFLACMESNGRPVTIVTHKREKYSNGAKYGYKISDLDHYLDHFNKMSWNYRNASFNQWYDDSTNFGMFQISPDNLTQKDNEKQRKVSSAFHNTISIFQNIARFKPNTILDKCFSKIMYLDEGVDPSKPLIKNLLQARSYDGLAPQNADSKIEWINRAQKIQSFAVSNILCPRLNLELAKVLMTLKPEYFGPHLVDSKRCGNRALTCRSTLNEIVNLLKTKMSPYKTVDANN